MHGSGPAFSVIFDRLGDPQKSALLCNVAFWVQMFDSFTAAAQRVMLTSVTLDKHQSGK